MSTFETLTFLGTILGMAIAIGAATNAKRSANAAETQARHAETQATAALTQAKAAKEQLDLAREVFDANTRAQAATDLALVGKAVSAINKHASAAGILALEAIARMDKSLARRKPDMSYLAEVTKSVPDVYPILSSAELVTEWKVLKAELDVLQPYILLQSIELIRDKVQGAMDQHSVNSPKDMIDAFGRCIKLNRDFLEFAKKFDV